jgi:GT2 family glycosyltransferase
MMGLGVIILNWNAAADTIACLRSIQAWQNISAQVWVVDNASEDGSVERIARECPYARLVRSEFNRGFAGGNNLALAQALEAGCEEILLLNNDAAIAEDDLARLIDVLRTRPSVGIVGPLLQEGAPPNFTLRAGGRDIAYHLATHIPVDDTAPATLRPVDYVPGTVALIRADVLHTAGLFDETYFFSGEMADLCQRVRTSGYECLIQPAARACHQPHARLGQRDTLYLYYSLRNRFLFIRKFYPEKKWRLFAIWVGRGLTVCVSAIAHGQLERARAACWALWDSLRGRYGNRNARFLDG